MNTLEIYVHRGRHRLRRLAVDPKVHLAARVIGYFLAGFCLAAAALDEQAQPLAMGLVCVCTGWSAVVAAVGGALGYWLFWNSAQGIIWVAVCLTVALFLGKQRIVSGAPLLLPAVASLITAFCGLVFQTWLGDDTAVGM